MLKAHKKVSINLLQVLFTTSHELAPYVHMYINIIINMPIVKQDVLVHT